jgi:hypothetical protein
LDAPAGAPLLTLTLHAAGKADPTAEVWEDKLRFKYFLEDHDDLANQVTILQNLGYVVDVTPGNTPIYPMSEEFVGLLLGEG